MANKCDFKNFLKLSIEEADLTSKGSELQIRCMVLNEASIFYLDHKPCSQNIIIEVVLGMYRSSQLILFFNSL